MKVSEFIKDVMAEGYDGCNDGLTAFAHKLAERGVLEADPKPRKLKVGDGEHPHTLELVEQPSTGEVHLKCGSWWILRFRPDGTIARFNSAADNDYRGKHHPFFEDDKRRGQVRID